jgi:L-fuconolactonase
VIIDSHQHFWDRSRSEFDYSWQDAPALAPIRRSFMPTDLKPLIDAAGVDRTIFVQTQHNVAENRWALGLAEENHCIAGVVGWVDLASDRCEEQLLEFIDHPKFVGVRHVTQDEPDDDFIVRPNVLRGLKVLEKHRVPFDLLFYVKHLRHAATLGRLLPDLPMVIDHLAKPRIKDRSIEDWLPHLRAAAACPNIFCKLSGMVTEADWQRWSPADLKPYVRHALDLFGPSRLMFGSDWPVCLLASDYGRVFRALGEALGPISDAEKRQIFGETARAFYKIGM